MKTNNECLDIRISGKVQGVGFRPFLYSLALEHRLKGWVRNTADGVLARVSGDKASLTMFLEQITTRKPRYANIRNVICSLSELEAPEDFSIIRSENIGTGIEIPADASICPLCISELIDPVNRRFQYPFITCSDCGPRFTIIKSLPFDREGTSMADFSPCNDCQGEYLDPKNRRFHAQTISCPACGPQLSLVDAFGDRVATSGEAIFYVSKALQRGNIVALKGIGGYQLVVCAHLESAVLELRRRKHRPEKPFAVMVGDISSAKSISDLCRQEMRCLTSKESPIVLLDCLDHRTIANAVTLGLSTIGLMMPSSPLHWLLLQKVGTPLVVTSGNQPGNPIAIDEEAAFRELGNIADYFLIHNRKIYHRADDPIVRVIGNQDTLIRHGRGFSPYYFPTSFVDSTDMVALGGHLKSSFALHCQGKLTIGQHIGDLGSVANLEYLKSELKSYSSLLGLEPTTMLCDEHPEYGSTRLAETMSPRVVKVQHHKAHIMSCVLENRFYGEALGIGWDGVGFGTEAESWGGEFFWVNTAKKRIERCVSFLPFRLLGSDSAAREPRKIGLSVAWQIWGETFIEDLRANNIGYCVDSFSQWELNLLQVELRKTMDGPSKTSSVGRLFDAVASYLNLQQICSFEGQGAMRLEGSADKYAPFRPYCIKLNMTDGETFIDWRIGLKELILDIKNCVSSSQISARFHHTLAYAVELVLRQREVSNVILSGGVFQNKFLVEIITKRLEGQNVTVMRNGKIPPNDAGLSAGQIAYHLYQMDKCTCV